MIFFAMCIPNSDIYVMTISKTITYAIGFDLLSDTVAVDTLRHECLLLLYPASRGIVENTY